MKDLLDRISEKVQKQSKEAFSAWYDRWYTNALSSVEENWFEKTVEKWENFVDWPKKPDGLK